MVRYRIGSSAMSRGPLFAPFKLLGETKAGSVPVAKVLLPQFSAATPIRLVTGGGRRIAEARTRRPT